jgi:hypothetical protein
MACATSKEKEAGVTASMTGLSSYRSTNSVICGVSLVRLLVLLCPLCATQRMHGGSCSIAHREFRHCHIVCTGKDVRVGRHSRAIQIRDRKQKKTPRVPTLNRCGTHVRVRKAALPYPTAAASAPQPPAFIGTAHRTTSLMHRSRLAAACGFRCTHPATKGFSAPLRSIEKGNSPPGAPMQRPRLAGTRVTPSRGEQLFAGCVLQSASAGPAAAVPLVRVGARLGQAVWLAGWVAKASIRKLQHKICLQASKETWIVGEERRGGSAETSQLREPQLVARAPRGLETFTSATIPGAIGED